MKDVLIGLIIGLAFYGMAELVVQQLRSRARRWDRTPPRPRPKCQPRNKADADQVQKRKTMNLAESINWLSEREGVVSFYRQIPMFDRKMEICARVSIVVDGDVFASEQAITIEGTAHEVVRSLIEEIKAEKP